MCMYILALAITVIQTVTCMEEPTRPPILHAAIKIATALTAAAISSVPEKLPTGPFVNV